MLVFLLLVCCGKALSLADMWQWRRSDDVQQNVLSSKDSFVEISHPITMDFRNIVRRSIQTNLPFAFPEQLEKMASGHHHKLKHKKESDKHKKNHHKDIKKNHHHSHHDIQKHTKRHRDSGKKFKKAEKKQKKKSSANKHVKGKKGHDNFVKKEHDRGKKKQGEEKHLKKHENDRKKKFYDVTDHHEYDIKYDTMNEFFDHFDANEHEEENEKALEKHLQKHENKHIDKDKTSFHEENLVKHKDYDKKKNSEEHYSGKEGHQSASGHKTGHPHGSHSAPVNVVTANRKVVPPTSLDEVLEKEGSRTHPVNAIRVTSRGRMGVINDPEKENGFLNNEIVTDETVQKEQHVEKEQNGEESKKNIPTPVLLTRSDMNQHEEKVENLKNIINPELRKEAKQKRQKYLAKKLLDIPLEDGRVLHTSDFIKEHSKLPESVENNSDPSKENISNNNQPEVSIQSRSDVHEGDGTSNGVLVQVEPSEKDLMVYLLGPDLGGYGTKINSDNSESKTSTVKSNKVNPLTIKNKVEMKNKINKKKPTVLLPKIQDNNTINKKRVEAPGIYHKEIPYSEVSPLPKKFKPSQTVKTVVQDIPKTFDQNSQARRVVPKVEGGPQVSVVTGDKLHPSSTGGHKGHNKEYKTGKGKKKGLHEEHGSKQSHHDEDKRKHKEKHHKEHADKEYKKHKEAEKKKSKKAHKKKAHKSHNKKGKKGERGWKKGNKTFKKKGHNDHGFEHHHEKFVYKNNKKIYDNSADKKKSKKYDDFDKIFSDHEKKYRKFADHSGKKHHNSHHKNSFDKNKNHKSHKKSGNKEHDFEGFASSFEKFQKDFDSHF